LFHSKLLNNGTIFLLKTYYNKSLHPTSHMAGVNLNKNDEYYNIPKLTVNHDFEALYYISHIILSLYISILTVEHF